MKRCSEKPCLESVLEGAFNSDSHENLKPNYEREARFDGKDGDCSDADVIERQIGKVRIAYAALNNPKGNCPVCGMGRHLWSVNSGRGIASAGEWFCCQGCAEGFRCTCQLTIKGG